MIDGQEMTVAEIADMLGITPRALTVRKTKCNGASYQSIVNMYRQNLFCTKHDKFVRHYVEGRWVTIQDMARELGIARNTLVNWRTNHRLPDGSLPTLAEAVEHYRKYKTGELKRHTGYAPKAHRVNGKKMTVKSAAEKYGTTENALRKCMWRYKTDLNGAIQHLEERRRRRAAQAIMDILKGR